MDAPSQAVLIDIPEQPAQQKPEPKAPPKLRTVNRLQTILAHICVEELIAPDHKARAIWQLVERMDLSRFCEPLRTTLGGAGRAAWDPLLLVSVWIYAYSEGISSAREIARVMEWEPGLQWLGGLAKVNHHTLSDFRVEHRQALDELFAELLAMLESAGVVSLEQVMHDGTKIRAVAGADTFRREKTLRERLQEARAQVAQRAPPSGGADERSQASGAGTSHTGALGTPGSGAKRNERAAGGEEDRSRKSRGAGKSAGTGSAVDEARRQRHCPELQRADQHRGNQQDHRGSAPEPVQ